MDNKITLEHISHAKKPDGEVGTQTLNRMNNSHDELTNWALSFLPEIKLNKALDIGCGGGATIKRLLDKYPDSFIHGVDYSLTSVELSKEFNKDILGQKCEVAQADVHKLTFDDNSFELITAFETVYFWGDINSAFTQVNRCLTSGGYFLICCEMSDSANPRWENVLEEMHILDISSWSDYLSANNFELVSSHELNEEWICLISKKI